MNPRSPLKTSHKGLYLIAEVDSLSEDAMTAMGFRFTDISLVKNANGWLTIMVDWTAKHDEWRVKYPLHSGTGYGAHYGGFDGTTVEFEFPQVAAPYYSPGASPFEVYDGAATHKAHITVGLAVKPSRTFKPFPWDYVYYDNTKYGVHVHFAPTGWDRGKYKALFNWRGRGSGT